MSTVSRYTRTAVILHWAIAFLILGNIALGLVMKSVPDEWVRLSIDTHKSLGITVLGLVLLRIIWRFRHQPPALPASFPRLEVLAAHWAHIVLYALMLILPLSGWLHDSAWKHADAHPLKLFQLIPWPRIEFIMTVEPAFKETLHSVFGLIHEGAAFVLYGVLTLHLAGVIKHEFIDRDSVLKRMSWRKDASNTESK